MKEVQQALAATGIPAFALAWKSTASDPVPPDSYLVYTTRTYESEHWDDTLKSYTVNVYLNLWTKLDPTDSKLLVRKAMRAAGFEMAEEAVSYEDSTDMTLVAWTWSIELPPEVIPDGN